MNASFVYHPGLRAENPFGSAIIAFAGRRLLLPGDTPGPAARAWQVFDRPVPCTVALQLGTLDGTRLCAVSLPEPPPGQIAVSLRDYLALAPPAEARLASTAAQLLAWMETQNFCSRCGHPLLAMDDDRALICQPCGFRSYPRLAPCVITLVYRPGAILLALSLRHRDSGMHSCLAGFVEAGESAEEAVVREVAEESGVCITAPQYLCSQSWPFPHQLMLGYLAPWQGGALRPQVDEIAHLGWYGPDALPLIPPPGTIARTLIEHALEHCI